MSRKIALAITLISIMFASTFVALPVAGLDWSSASTGERQIVVPGTLYDEMFPEFNYTYWQKNSMTVGFTQYGETVTDQDPLGVGSAYGVGLTYPSVEDPDVKGSYVAEHIACPSISSGPSPGGLIYIPVEGWQLFWKWDENTPGYAIDPSWHISMAIFGNQSAPYGTRARLDVKLPEELGYEAQGMHVITNTSRLFAVKTHFYTYNSTLQTTLGLDPVVFEIELIYVFFKDTKKLVQFWTVQYLKSEYGAVDVVFRRLTDFSVDSKFQEYESENFAVMFPNQTSREQREVEYNNPFATGCDYWPQDYTLGLAWTNETIAHWNPSDAQHHLAYIAYYPNCSNWDTDNWNWYLTNLWTQWPKGNSPIYLNLDPERVSLDWDETTTGPGPLTVRYGDQPMTYEVQDFDPDHIAASPLMMGQWNFTLTAATAKRMAKFVNVMGVTNVSDTFGYVNDKYNWDWDSDGDMYGMRTMSEVKYYLAECFNATYKLSSEWDDMYGNPLDMSEWFPFSGVEWAGIDPYSASYIAKVVTEDNPRNTTFIYGDTVSHNGAWFTDGAAHVVDVVGGTEVAGDFGGEVGDTGYGHAEDPWFEALWDTTGFMGETPGPFVPGVAAPDFYFELTMETYLDPVAPNPEAGPIMTDLMLTAIRRMSNRRGSGLKCSNQYINYMTTPTGCGWNISHIVAVGGPVVNLATEYFNDHVWAVWTSAASGCEFSELADGGIYVFPSGNMYPAGEDGGYSVVTIAEDLNLTSWTSIYDQEMFFDESCSWTTYDTGPGVDGPTLVDPYAALLIYGMSGWDTRAAANWVAQYRSWFNGLYTNATHPKMGVTTLILNTAKVQQVCSKGWDYGIVELLGPVAGRWRLSSTAWGVWISAPISIEW